MTDEAPVGSTNDDGETWVTVLFGSSERAPGIDDASGTTYRAPRPEGRRRAFLIGGAIVLAVVAVAGAIALSSGTSGESAGRARRPDRKVALPVSTTSTTWDTTPSAPSTTVATTATTTAPPATTPTTAAPPPPTPRATADPAAPKYTPVPLPAGVSATLTGCSWQPTGSGRYEASGTLTNGPGTQHGWTITIHWLQDGREVGEQSAAVNLGAGASTPWELSLGAPTPPADPFSCALSVA